MFFTQVPTWSASRKDYLVAGVRFLVFRFRLDSWWFGVPLLVRGPLLSLPVVLATDYPPIQVIAIAMVMAGLLVTWKHTQPGQNMLKRGLTPLRKTRARNMWKIRCCTDWN